MKCKNIYCTYNLPEDTLDHYETLCEIDINPEKCYANSKYIGLTQIPNDRTELDNIIDKWDAILDNNDSVIKRDLIQEFMEDLYILRGADL